MRTSASATCPSARSGSKRQRAFCSLASASIPLFERRPATCSRLDRLGIGQRGPRQRILRVEAHRLPEMLDACRHACLCPASDQRPSLQVEPIRLRILPAPLRRGPHLRLSLRRLPTYPAFSQERRSQLLHHRLRDVILHREDVFQLAVVGLRPQMSSRWPPGRAAR